MARTNLTRRLPAFFVVGPPRTGTTWLHEVLKRHVVLPRGAKETRFFDIHFHRGFSWYLSLFPKSVPDKKVGEVAPTYFASAHARCKIRELIPHAKIVCIFRHPVDRLLSLYRLKRAYGWIPWTLEEAICLDEELTESSKYATHLRAWQETFGKDQVLPTLFDDLREHSQSYIDRVADFIEVPRFHLAPEECAGIHSSEVMTLPRNYHRTRAARLMVEWLEAHRLGPILSAARNSPLNKMFLGGGQKFPELNAPLPDYMYELFRKEVDELEIILKRDLSAWKPSVLARAEYAAVA